MSVMYRRLSTLKCIVTALALILTSASSAPASDDSVLIKRKYQPSKAHYTENKVDIVQRVSSPGMPGGAMEIKVTQLYGIREKAKESADGRHLITLTFERAMQRLDMPMMGAVEYDTDDPDDPDAAPMLSAIYDNLVGESITIEVDEAGEVVGFAGMDAINAKISERAAVNQFWMMMKDYFTDKRGREDWAVDPLRIYPNRTVKVGDTWKSESQEENPQLGKSIVKYEYKLDKLTTEAGRKVAHISYKAAETGIPPEGEDAAKVEIDGSTNGKAVYDIERGLVVRHSAESKKKVIAPAQAVSGGAGDMTIEIKLDSDIRVLEDRDRTRQKEVAARKIAERKAAEEDDDDDDDDDD